MRQNSRFTQNFVGRGALATGRASGHTPELLTSDAWNPITLHIRVHPVIGQDDADVDAVRAKVTAHDARGLSRVGNRVHRRHVCVGKKRGL
jgi:hypothetical protein